MSRGFRQFERRHEEACERARTRFRPRALQTENTLPAPDPLAALGGTLFDPVYPPDVPDCQPPALPRPPDLRENDPKRLAQIAEEVITEGRVHRNTRPQRHE